MRRVVSLWLPRFPTDRLCRQREARVPRNGQRSDDWRAEPLVTVAGPGTPGGTPEGGPGGNGAEQRLVAVNQAAELAGLFPGQALADARALEPGLRVAAAALAADMRSLTALADWCGRYSPWTAPSGLEAGGAGGIWLDISGCAHLFGDETALLADLVQRLGAIGYATRAAIADTPGAAWAVARFAPLAAAMAVTPPGGQMAALTALPVAALRLTPAQREDLDRLGLRRIGDLLPLPRAGLAARFGATLSRRLDQALGQIDEPISPRRPAPVLRLRLAFPEPVAQLDAVKAAARRLLTAMDRRLEAAGRGARQLELALYRTSGQVDIVTAGTSRPSRQPNHLMRLLAEQLDRLPAADGLDTMIDLVILAVQRSEPMTAAQETFATNDAATGHANPAALAALVDRLSSRLGAASVMQLRARESHVPERAQVAVAALAKGHGNSRGNDGFAAGPSAPRPPRLLPRPEPVTAVAPVPDDPPVLFRWRGRVHRVVRADGPERIGPEWWRTAGDVLPRDYYRIEDTGGQRFWLYRHGLYQPGSGSGRGATPQWYLHGLFG